MSARHIPSRGLWWLLALGIGCGSTGGVPSRTAPLRVPTALAGAVAVPSARFLGVDPSQTLTNSQLRNCRFGRSERIPLVPALVEQTPDALRALGRPLVDLPEGRLPLDDAEAMAALRAALRPLAERNRALAARACHPWRASPDDPAQTPSLLLAIDAAAPAQDLLRISAVAREVGLDRQALWVLTSTPPPYTTTLVRRVDASPADPDAPPLNIHWAVGGWSAHTPDGQVLPLEHLESMGRVAVSVAAPENLPVQDVVAVLGTLREQGLPCAALGTGQEAGAPHTAALAGAAAESLELRGSISVIPLHVGGVELVSGELCAPEAAAPSLDLSPP